MHIYIYTYKNPYLTWARARAQAGPGPGPGRQLLGCRAELNQDVLKLMGMFADSTY